MDKLYKNRETERKVYDRAINDNSKGASKITENEKYLDVWYKLQNGEMEWPNFIEGKPNARQVIEAAIQDVEHGKGNYIASFKGMGNHEKRDVIKAHSTTGADFGDMVYSSTRRTTGANYAYDDFGLERVATNEKPKIVKNDNGEEIYQVKWSDDKGNHRFTGTIEQAKAQGLVIETEKGLVPQKMQILNL